MELKLWEREWLDISFKKAGLSPSYLNLPTKIFTIIFIENYLKNIHHGSSCQNLG